MGSITVNIQKKDGYKEIDSLLEYLTVLGAEISAIERPKSNRASSVQVTIEIPDKRQLEAFKKARTRNAGRKSITITPREGSEIKGSTTCAEFLDWLYDHHTPDDAMYELQLKRATYYNKLKEIKKPENANVAIRFI